MSLFPASVAINQGMADAATAAREAASYVRAVYRLWWRPRFGPRTTALGRIWLCILHTILFEVGLLAGLLPFIAWYLAVSL